MTVPFIALKHSAKPAWLTLVLPWVGLAVITLAGLAFFSGLGVMVITLLYLLCVLWAAYFLHFSQALLTAVAAVLLINFCFIEPRYTLAIASVQSWAMLIVFAVVALTVSHAMQQLKWQKQQAEWSAWQSGFFQSLAERLATASSIEVLLQTACQQMQTVLGWQVSVVEQSAAGQLTTLAGTPPAGLDAGSVQWAQDFQRAIGAGTADWPALPWTLLPFGQDQRAVMVIVHPLQVHEMAFVRLLVQQCAQAMRQLTQQLALARAERAANEAGFKKTLLTALSHDMRTPLTAILGAVHVLTDQHIRLAPPQSAQLLESIQAEARYLSLATENILTLVKLDVAPQSLQRDWTSPQDIIQHVTQRYDQRVPAVPLQVSGPGTAAAQEALFEVDAVLVAHALSNLIDNALQWQDPESAIRLAWDVEASWLVLSVSNQGPGFPPGFEISTFVAARPSSAHRGFGLGLSIVQTLMQLHHGQLEMLQREPRHTQVRLKFPYQLPAHWMKEGGQ